MAREYLKDIESFLEEKTEFGAFSIAKEELYTAYRNWADEREIPWTHKEVFSKFLFRICGDRIRTSRKLIKGKRVYSWRGLRLIRCTGK